MSEGKLFGLNEKTGRWLFIPLGIVMFICLGTVYSWSVFKHPVEKLFGIDATLSGLPYMVFLICYAFVMALTGIFLEKFGPKRIIIVGGLLVGTGWILSGFVASIYLLTITYGVLAGSGVGIVYGAPVLVVAKWFPKRKGFAVGWILLGFGLSPFVTAPIAKTLIDEVGALNTFRILGTVFIMIVPLLGMLFRLPENHSSSNNTSLTKDTIWNDLLKKKSFYGLWICFTIGTLIGLMIIGVTSPIGQEIIKLTPERATVLVSLFAVFNAIGRPFFGWLCDRFSPTKAAIFSYVLILLASIIMLFAKEETVTLYIIAFSIFWLNLGGWLAIAPAATATFFEEKHYSRNYGIVFTAYGIGAVIGNLLSGGVKDTFGSYQYIFYPIIVLALMGIIIAPLLMKLNKNMKVD